MSDYNLLMVYAGAVRRMRELQCIEIPASMPSGRSLLAYCEREVDELTALHLMPPLPPIAIPGAETDADVQPLDLPDLVLPPIPPPAANGGGS